MRLSLAQDHTLNELASLLYDFLPGQPHPYADKSMSFGGVAASLGMSQFWQGGSKLPAVSKMLRSVLEQRPQKFCPLIIEVVRKGMVYRQSKGKPVTRDAILRLNELLKFLEFKIPELHDAKFLGGLPRAKGEADIILSEKLRKSLAAHLVGLAKLDPQPRGYAFETFLKDLFEHFKMAPREAFRLVGEQIDGSLQFQEETYLLEATWRNKPLGQEELLAFSGKVAGKASWSRGLLISYAGFTAEGLEAFARGKPTQIVCMDGLDLHELLDKNLPLTTVLDRKVRRAAETNEAFVPLGILFPQN